MTQTIDLKNIVAGVISIDEDTVNEIIAKNTKFNKDNNVVTLNLKEAEEVSRVLARVRRTQRLADRRAHDAEKYLMGENDPTAVALLDIQDYIAVAQNWLQEITDKVEQAIITHRADEIEDKVNPYRGTETKPVGKDGELIEDGDLPW